VTPELVLRELIRRYAAGDDAERAELRAPLARHRWFRWGSWRSLLLRSTWTISRSG
jgi:hypothetical protein